MKRFVIFTMMIFFPFLAYSDQYVQGIQSGTWYASLSPYRVVGDVSVNEPWGLTIEPGVEVIFTGNFQIEVESFLVANGNADSLITFTSINPEPTWRRIIFNDANPSELSYCHIEYAIENAIRIVKSNLNVSNCTIANNGENGSTVNGIIYIEERSSLVMAYSEIGYNVGSGIYIDSSVNQPINSNATLDHCHIHHNSAVGHGGGINVEPFSLISLYDCIVEDNAATEKGGGIKLNGCTNVLGDIVRIIRCTIMNNIANNGGGLYISGGSNVIVEESNISYNQGTGVIIEDNSTLVSLYNSTISYNQGSGITADNYCEVDLNTCFITNNIQAGDTGGALNVGGNSITFSINNCVIRENSSRGPAAIYAPGSATTSLYINNCDISENNVLPGPRDRIMYFGCYTYIKNTKIHDHYEQNADIHVWNNPRATIFENCTIFNNGGGIDRHNSNQLEMFNSIFWDPDGIGATTIRYSCIHPGNDFSGIDTLGIIFDDPQFIDDSFHISDNSPCIDKGDPYDTYNDFCSPPSLGDERNDMGAFGGPKACIWSETNIAPNCLAADLTVVIGTSFTIDLNYLVDDPNGDPVYIDLITDMPDFGYLDVTLPTSITYIPISQYPCSDSFGYRVCDFHGACCSNTITLNLVQASNNGYAVIIGGDEGDQPEFWPVIENLSSLMNSTFQQGFQHERIRFLSAHPIDFNGDDIDENDNIATLAQVRQALVDLPTTNGLGANDKFVIYLIGQAEAGKFLLANSDTLYADSLAAWINYTQSVTDNDSTFIVMDFSHAESFLTPLMIPTPNRVTIASSALDQEAVFNTSDPAQPGDISFSYFFTSEINSWNSRGLVWNSFVAADSLIKFHTSDSQTALFAFENSIYTSGSINIPEPLRAFITIDYPIPTPQNYSPEITFAAVSLLTDNLTKLKAGATNTAEMNFSVYIKPPDFIIPTPAGPFQSVLLDVEKVTLEQSMTNFFAYYNESFELEDTAFNFQLALNYSDAVYHFPIAVDNKYWGDVVSIEAPDMPIETTQFHLSQNYPNPFNPLTTIQYNLPVESIVNLKIYNIAGQLVDAPVRKKRQIGPQEVIWQAAGLSSGVYFYQLTTKSVQSNEKFEAVKKMVFLK